MIRELHLHNFKCFEDQTFQLKPLTLLTGLNSTGKSSVLQSLLLLRQSHLQELLWTTGLMLGGNLVNIGVGKDALFEGAKDEELGIDITMNSDFIDESADSIDETSDFIDETAMSWRFKCNPTADVLELLHAPLLGPDKYPTEREIFNDNYSSYSFLTGLFNDYFHYLQAERIGPRLFFEASDFQVRRQRQLGTKGEYTAHFLSIFGKEKVIEPLAHKNADSLTLSSQVEAWLGEISPGTRITLTPNTGMELVELRYSSKFGTLPGSSDTLPSSDYRSTNVGFGITYVLPILVAILSSTPRTLLLIENPEAHLHPRGQAQIGDLLARAAASGIQVIIETHSDHILNGIRLAVHDGKLNPDDTQLHFFQRNEQDGMTEVISPHIDQDGRIDQWPTGFFDEWERDLMALLEPRGE